MGAPEKTLQETSEQRFRDGLFCAEAVLETLAARLGAEADFIPAMATGFCGGVARSGGMCGALSGAIMAIGLAKGRSAPEQSVEEAYAATRALLDCFEKEFGSTDCRTLLDGCDLGTPEGQERFTEEKLAKQCLRYSGGAARMAGKVLALDAD